MSDEQRQQQAKDNQGYVEDLIGRVNHAGIEQLNNLVFNSGGKLVDAMKGGRKTVSELGCKFNEYPQ